MRYLATFFLISTFLALSTLPIFSHGSGPPFLQINGKIADSNPIFTASTQDIALGQDIGPENLIVNEEIMFDIVAQNLPAPKEVVDRSVFNWDFGDGRKASGLKVSNTYSKSGTYIIKMTVTDPTQNTTFDLNTAQINILPSKNYTLPIARIKINGKLVADPLKDTFKVKKGDRLQFDASQSSGDGLTYKWDFGDGTSGDGEKVVHTYASDFFPSFPLLRVTDKNGVSDDAFAEFFDKDNAEGFFPNPNYKESTTTASETETKKDFPILPIALGGLVLLCVLGVVGKNFSGKKTNKINTSSK